MHIQFPGIPPTEKHRKRLRRTREPMDDVELGLDRAVDEAIGYLANGLRVTRGVVEPANVLD
jgi:hypothetical protein